MKELSFEMREIQKNNQLIFFVYLTLLIILSTNEGVLQHIPRYNQIEKKSKSGPATFDDIYGIYRDPHVRPIF